jgi:hypothetical protein
VEHSKSSQRDQADVFPIVDRQSMLRAVMQLGFRVFHPILEPLKPENIRSQRGNV